MMIIIIFFQLSWTMWPDWLRSAALPWRPGASRLEPMILFFFLFCLAFFFLFCWCCWSCWSSRCWCSGLLEGLDCFTMDPVGGSVGLSGDACAAAAAASDGASSSATWALRPRRRRVVSPGRVASGGRVSRDPDPRPPDATPTSTRCCCWSCWSCWSCCCCCCCCSWQWASKLQQTSPPCFSQCFTSQSTDGSTGTEGRSNDSLVRVQSFQCQSNCHGIPWNFDWKWWRRHALRCKQG